jgi:hypothetical protein
MRNNLNPFRHRPPVSTRDAPPFAPLRVAAAQMLVASGIGSTVERLAAPPPSSGPDPLPVRLLGLVPALLGPLGAAAQLAEVHAPSPGGRSALRILNTSAIALGSALVVHDLLADSRPPSRLSPLTLAVGGLLGLLIDHQEAEVVRAETELRLRASVVDRLVPRRRGRVDRIVVHV